MSRGRFLAFYVAPTLLVLAWFSLPLILGNETYYLRDVLNTHLGLKWAGAEALRAGELPWVDLWRGGQPLLGNLNAAPLYPDSLLYGVLPLFWTLNAHFWLHLLIAPLSMFWLGRAWGLGRPAAWAAGVLFASSGYFFSNLSFYNLIAGVALAPALVAASLELIAGRRVPSRVIAVGGIWLLMLLGGDPFLAALALLMTMVACLLHGRPNRVWRPNSVGRPSGAWRPSRAWWLWGAAVAAGTAIALPQLVEFLRILPDSYRGQHGFSVESATVASFDPRQALDWLIPLAFGRPDRIGLGSFWGAEYHTGRMAYYFSLYPGLLSFVLLAGSGWKRSESAGTRTGARTGADTDTSSAGSDYSKARIWGWALVAGGIFLSLGRFNPLMSWIFEFRLGRLMRYPVKFWLPVAIGLALLGGIGFARLVERSERGSIRRALTALSLVVAGGWLFLRFLQPAAESWIGALMPEGTPLVAIQNERARWAGLLLISLVLLLLLGGLVRLLRNVRTRAIAGSLLLLAHLAGQIFFLRATVATDDLAPYLEPSPVAEAITPDELVVHGSFRKLFGPSTLGRGEYPDGGSQWLERRAFLDLYPFAGAIVDRRYDLVGSPEGLDTFLSELALQIVERSTDAQRLRLLRAWGVDVLLLHRPLDQDLLTDAGLRQAGASFGQPLFIYELARSAPLLNFPGSVTYAPDVNAAVERLRGDGDFDPRSEVVLPGQGPALERPAGTILASDLEATRATVEVTSEQGGVLVLQRAFLSLYRATVDGQPVPVREANLFRLGIELPPGRHVVELWYDKRPFFLSLLGSLLGIVSLFVLARSAGNLVAAGEEEQPPRSR